MLRGIGDLHASAAGAAGHQSREQRQSIARSPQRLRAGLILLEPFEILEILIPGNVSRQPIPNQHLPLIDRPPTLGPPAAGTIGVLGVGQPPPIGVGPGVDRMVEHL